MRIKEFSIIRYGPLSRIEHVSLGNFNLFFGRNEEGKTLSIDALVKMLLRRNIRDFVPDINRVEENPEGYVIIENEESEEIKLPEKGDLTKLASLTSSECRNIFIIRNSDLSIVGESEFYTTVTDRLTGLKTKQILSIKKKLQELGKLTRPESTASLSDKEEFGKMKSRLNRSSKLIEEINILIDKIKKEGFDKLEEEFTKVREKKDEIKEEIEALEEARKREKYEKGKGALETLKQVLKKNSDLAVYNEKDNQLWRDSERDIIAGKKEKEQLLLELDKKEKKLQETSEILRKKEREFTIFEERRKKLDEEVKPEIRNYQMKSEELEGKEEKDKFFTPLMILFFIFLGVSLLGIIIKPSLLSYILTILFLILAGISGVFKFQLVKQRSLLAEMLERIKLNISRFGLKARDIEEILFRLQEFKEEYSERAGEVEEIKGEKKLLESEIKKLREERIIEVENKIGNARRKIEGVRRKVKEESLEGYSQKLKLKLEYDKLVKEQRSILKTLWGEKEKDLEKNILYWEKETKNLEKYKDKAEGIEYNEKNISELKEEERLLAEEQKKIRSKMAYFQKELAEIERKANEILRLELEEDYLHCKTSIDLEIVKNRLQEFIDKNEANKDNILGVMKIFEEIEREEEEKVSQLFGEDSSISKHFKEITDGLYREVIFNQEKGKIEIKRKDGLVLDAGKLSGGAYDQLYLSLRLALGEKLLKGKKGFFIMDDPFIKASPDRLQRQMEVLKKISCSGWQIIYFTAKGEVKDVLEDDINSRKVNYVEIKSRL